MPIAGAGPANSAIGNRHSAIPALGERLDSNQQPEAYEAPALPLSYAPVSNEGRGPASNRRPVAYEATALPSELPRRVHLRLAICDFQLGEGDTLVSSIATRQSQLANQQCNGWGSNPQHPVWKTGTLPVELPLRPSHMRRPGFEPGASALAGRRSCR